MLRLSFMMAYSMEWFDLFIQMSAVATAAAAAE
jgi:hypothetical protein